MEMFHDAGRQAVDVGRGHLPVRVLHYGHKRLDTV